MATMIRERFTRALMTVMVLAGSVFLGHMDAQTYYPITIGHTRSLTPPYCTGEEASSKTVTYTIGWVTGIYVLSTNTKANTAAGSCYTHSWLDVHYGGFQIFNCWPLFSEPVLSANLWLETAIPQSINTTIEGSFPVFKFEVDDSGHITVSSSGGFTSVSSCQLGTPIVATCSHSSCPS